MKGLAGLVGQAQAVTALRAAAAKPVHAYLFVGPPGTGKMEAAVAFAAMLVCPNGGDDGCETCRRVFDGTHPDVVVVEREGAALSIAQAQQVTRLATRSPLEATRTVLVLPDMHLARLNSPALLKTLEEPPASTVFVLLAEFVPPDMVTIASRCARVDFRALTEEQLAGALVAEGVPTERAASVAAARRGAPGPGAPAGRRPGDGGEAAGMGGGAGPARRFGCHRRRPGRGAPGPFEAKCRRRWRAARRPSAPGCWRTMPKGSGPSPRDWLRAPCAPGSANRTSATSASSGGSAPTSCVRGWPPWLAPIATGPSPALCRRSKRDEAVRLIDGLSADLAFNLGSNWPSRLCSCGWTGWVDVRPERGRAAGPALEARLGSYMPGRLRALVGMAGIGASPKSVNVKEPPDPLDLSAEHVRGAGVGDVELVARGVFEHHGLTPVPRGGARELRDRGPWGPSGCR